MAQQSPRNLPPIYNGEKMVVYGVITTKESPKDHEVSGKAVFKGTILGKKIEHSIPFTFNPVNASSPSLPTIHHLAAKALITDWQDQDKNKKEIVKLSIESSVISSHTAFIAVDEENSEPITGAVKVWDIQARLGYDSIKSRSSSIYSSNSESDNDSDDDLEEELECESECKEVPQVNSKCKEDFKQMKRVMKSSNLVPEASSAPLAQLHTVPVMSSTLNALIAAQRNTAEYSMTV